MRGTGTTQCLTALKKLLLFFKGNKQTLEELPRGVWGFNLGGFKPGAEIMFCAAGGKGGPCLPQHLWDDLLSVNL